MNKRLNLNRNSVFKKSIKDDKDIIENVKDLIGIIKNRYISPSPSEELFPVVSIFSFCS